MLASNNNILSTMSALFCFKNTIQARMFKLLWLKYGQLVKLLIKT